MSIDSYVGAAIRLSFCSNEFLLWRLFPLLNEDIRYMDLVDAPATDCLIEFAFTM